MLGYDTSMKVVEESFRIKTYFSFGIEIEEVHPEFDVISFWIILPKGMCNKFEYNPLLEIRRFVFNAIWYRWNSFRV